MYTAVLDCAGKLLDMSRTQVMGILNITPDSFSDGGDFFSLNQAIARAREMMREGAAIIDVGGESTRPRAQPVPVDVELERVIPVIEGITRELPIPVSVDTSKPEVMRAAVAAGAGMINDICALRTTGALEAAAQAGVPICLMHMQGEPGSMQYNPSYENVVTEVKQFLAQRIKACLAAGIERSKILVDPGFGFGKSLQHNLTLLNRLQDFQELGVPVMVGLSRKSMLGIVLNAPVKRRLYGSIAAAVLAVWQGASIVRVHDVRATVEAVKICDAVKGNLVP